MASSNTVDDTETHTVLPTTPHTHTVIFLHGRGSNASTFCSEIFESQDTASRFFPSIFPSIKWVFPCAKQSLASSEGDIRYQWFDMPSVQRPWEGPDVQKPGLHESAARLVDVVRREGELVGGLDKLIVAGLSQGCATSIFSLLSADLRLGGFVGVCGWLPLKDELDEILKMPGRANGVLQMRALIQHCNDDFVVPVENGKDLADWLAKARVPVELELFDEGGHWLNEPKGMDGIVRFIEGVLKHDKETVV